MLGLFRINTARKQGSARNPVDMMYLYMVTNRKPGSPSAAQIGCCSDVPARLALYNSDAPVPGSDRRTRQAAGHWKALVVVEVPPGRELSARALSEQWKVKSRKIHCRFSYGASLAESLRLPWYVNVDELKNDERISGKEKKLVERICASAGSAQDAGEGVAGCRRVSSGAADPGQCIFDGVSFAKNDKPRQRYRKKKKRNGSGGKGGTKTGGVAKPKPRFLRKATHAQLAKVLSSSLQ